MFWLDILPRDLREELDAFRIEVCIQRLSTVIYVDVYSRYGKLTCVQNMHSIMVSLVASFKPDPSCTFGSDTHNVTLRDTKVWLTDRGTRLALHHSEGIAVISKLRYGIAQLE